MLNFIKFVESVSEDNYSGTFWCDVIDGVDVKITIQDVETYLKDNIVVDILVDDIFHLCAHKNKKDKVTLDRSEASDLSFPIIVAKNSDDEYVMVLDGMHRLLKAKNNGMKTIKAKILNLKNAPDLFKKMFGDR